MTTVRERRRRLWIWTFVFALNLAIPLFLGLDMTDRGGRFGLGIAIVVGWAAGVFICYQSDRVGVVLVRGGAWVAASQFIPLLQVGAGIVGIVCLNQIAGHGAFAEGGLRAELSGFALTLFTGSILFLAAMVFGGGLRLIFGPQEVEGESAADYADVGSAPDTGHPCR
jgi:hypothetical protein